MGKRTLLVRGNIFAEGFVDCENGGNAVAYVSEDLANTEDAIVIDGDITVKGDLLVDYELYATGTITCMKRRGE